MAGIDKEMDDIIEEVIEKEALRDFVVEIIEWENEMLHKERRKGKSRAIQKKIEETLKDW